MVWVMVVVSKDKDNIVEFKMLTINIVIQHECIGRTGSAAVIIMYEGERGGLTYIMLDKVGGFYNCRHCYSGGLGMKCTVGV